MNGQETLSSYAINYAPLQALAFIMERGHDYLFQTPNLLIFY